MEAVELPANLYAKVTYEGSLDQAYQAYDFLYQWISDLEYELAGDDGIERYNEHHIVKKEGHGSLDLFLPIKKLI